MDWPTDILRSGKSLSLLLETGFFAVDVYTCLRTTAKPQRHESSPKGLKKLLRRINTTSFIIENSNTIRLFYANCSQQYADWIDILERSEPRPPRNVTAKQEKLDRFLSRWSLCSVYILEIWRLAGSRWLGTCYMLGAWFGPSKGWKMEAKHRATRLGAELAVLRIDYSSISLGPLYSSWLAIIQNFEVIHWLIDAYVVCSTLWSLTGKTSITRPTQDNLTSIETRQGTVNSAALGIAWSHVT